MSNEIQFKLHHSNFHIVWHTQSQEAQKLIMSRVVYRIHFRLQWWSTMVWFAENEMIALPFRPRKTQSVDFCRDLVHLVQTMPLVNSGLHWHGWIHNHCGSTITRWRVSVGVCFFFGGGKHTIRYIIMPLAFETKGFCCWLMDATSANERIPFHSIAAGSSGGALVVSSSSRWWWWWWWWD